MAGKPTEGDFDLVLVENTHCSGNQRHGIETLGQGSRISGNSCQSNAINNFASSRDNVSY